MAPPTDRAGGGGGGELSRWRQGGDAALEAGWTEEVIVVLCDLCGLPARGGCGRVPARSCLSLSPH